MDNFEGNEHQEKIFHLNMESQTYSNYNIDELILVCKK